MSAIQRLYHFTDRARLQSIAERGLDPSMSREPAWRDRGCYLSADASHACAYDGHHGDWQGPGALVFVDISALDESLLAPDDVDLPDLLPDKRDLDEVGWEESLVVSGQCRYLGVIPAESLSILDPETNDIVPLEEAARHEPAPSTPNSS